MLFKFKSKAAGDLIMLESNGQRVLEIIGKASGPKGIILAAEMPAAIKALHAAIEADEAERATANAQAKADGKPPPRLEAVTLRQRAHPFIAMLNECSEAGKEIVWGV